MTDSQQSIEIFSLKKSFKGRTVLEIDKASLPAGKIIGIIGPSGAGKTTLLRILNMLEKPDCGEVKVLGHYLSAQQSNKLQLQREMAMVFQKSLMFDTTVYENIAFGLKARKLPKEEIKKLVESALVNINMLEQAKQKAKTLSGGEAQRVAMARAIVTNPKVLLLDEPTASLDPQNIEILEKQILNINKKNKTTVIIITHNLLQAKRLAQHLLFFYKGKLEEQGSAKKVFNNAEKDSTKSFIRGEMIY